MCRIEINFISNYKDLTWINNCKLTNRQIDVAACLIEHLKIKEIAKILSISPSTVIEHQSRLKNIIFSSRVNVISSSNIKEFFKSSEKYLILKKHAAQLLIQYKFKQTLLTIRQDLEVNPESNIFFHEEISKSSVFGNKFQEHLKLIGIKSNIFKLSEKTNNIIGNKIIVVLCKQNNQEEDYKISKEDIVVCIGNERNSNDHALSYYEGFVKILTLLTKNKNISKRFDPFYEAKNIYENNMLLTGAKKTIPLLKKRKKVFIFLLLTIFISLLLFWQNSFICFYHKTIHTAKIGKRKIHLHTWNLPNQQDYYVDRKEIIDTIWKKLNASPIKNRISISLYGLGGIGKTSLATKIVHKPKNDYTFIGWLSAETEDLLKTDFLGIGEKIHLFAKDMSDKLKIEKVKEWLNKQEKILLVYDNIEDMKTVHSYLPNRGHIIFTSRNYNMPNPISVNVMTEKQALALLSKLVLLKAKKEMNYAKNAKRLVKNLDYIPLAISQAGAYINENMLTLDEYLVLYKDSKKKILSEHTLPPGDRHEPIYVTLEINAKSIKEEPNGKQALALLNFIAYCYPENIPKKMLMEYLYNSSTSNKEILLNKALKTLRKYSFIKISPKTISIHRLVHDWIKHEHLPADKINFLKKAASSISTICLQSNHFGFNNKNLKFTKHIINQGEYILSSMQPLLENRDIVLLVTALGYSYYHLRDYSKSKSLFEMALTINKKIIGVNHINTSILSQKLGSTYSYLGKYKEAKNLLTTTLNVQRAYYKKDNMQIASTLHYMGWATLGLGEFDKAKEYFFEALDIKKTLYKSNHIGLSNTLEGLGWAYHYLGRYKKAQKLLKTSLAIKRKHYNANHPEIAATTHRLGWTTLHLGDFVTAKKFLEEELAIRKVNHGSDHPDVGHSLLSIGWCYLLMGDILDAKKAFLDSLKIRKLYYGEQHPHTAYALSSLGWVNKANNNYINAKKLFKKSLAIRKQTYDSEHMFVAHTLNNLGIVEFSQGNYESSVKFFKEAISIVDKHHKNTNVFKIFFSFNLGNTYRVMGNLKESKNILEKSFNALQHFYDNDSVHTALAMSNLGLLYNDNNDYKKKNKYLTMALEIYNKQLPPKHAYIERVKYLIKNNKKQALLFPMFFPF